MYLSSGFPGYTMAELDAGQLDTRYYTETEITAARVPYSGANANLVMGDHSITAGSTYAATINDSGNARSAAFTDGTRYVHLSNGTQAGFFSDGGSYSATLGHGSYAGYFYDGTRTAQFCDSSKAGYFYDGTRTAQFCDGSLAGYFYDGTYYTYICTGSYGIDTTGYINTSSGYSYNGSAGYSGSFPDNNGATVSVSGGIIMSVM